MDRIRIPLIALVVALILAITPTQAQPAPEEPTDGIVPGRVLVRFRESATEAQIQGAVQASSAVQLGRGYDDQLRIVAVQPGREQAEAQRWAQHPDVLYAEPDYLVRAFVAPDDPLYGEQWSLPLAGFDAAWDLSTGAESVTVAVIDSGVDTTHPDLAGRLLPGRNFTTEGAPEDVSDQNGHGTHVAGIVAAVGNNGIGVAGTSWQTKLLPVKVLDRSGLGSVSQVAAGIHYAVDQGADILNMSFGTYGGFGNQEPQVLKEAIDAAEAKGLLVVAAAGNDGRYCAYPEPWEPGSCNFPAVWPYVLSVGATNRSDVRASYSNFGPFLDIVAPGGQNGERILSTLPRALSSGSCTESGCYGGLYGTSQATPHVAGLAAIMRAISPTMSVDAVRTVIQSTAVDLGNPGRDDQYGDGRINAAAAVEASTQPSLQATPRDLHLLIGPGSETRTTPVSVTATSEDGSPQIPFVARTDQPWLLVDGGRQVERTTPAMLAVSIDATQLPAGTVATGTVQLSRGTEPLTPPTAVVDVRVYPVTQTVKTVHLILAGVDLQLE